MYRERARLIIARPARPAFCPENLLRTIKTEKARATNPAFVAPLLKTSSGILANFLMATYATYNDAAKATIAKPPFAAFLDPPIDRDNITIPRAIAKP